LSKTSRPRGYIASIGGLHWLPVTLGAAVNEYAGLLSPTPTRMISSECRHAAMILKLAAVTFSLTLGLSSTSLPAEGRPPNVIIIYTDDQGYEDIGVYGAKGIATPHLDRMAAEGRRFTDFYAAQPVCTSSRVALLTGCYPNRIGLGGALGPKSKIGINPVETTLAELFKRQGYATGMAGKWHLGDHPTFLPTRHGFDEYFGIPYSNDMWPRHPTARPGSYPPLPLLENETVVNADVQPSDQDEFTRLFTERAVHFIEQNHARPFFFYLAHPQPHVPLHASARFKGKSPRGAYGDSIMEIDWSVGEVLAALRRHHIDEQTIIMYSSDNGPWLTYGDHGGSAGGFREGKHTIFEGGVRVPFIVRWPGRIPANSVSREPVMNIDILPTLATLVEAPMPPLPIDGRDVSSLLLGKPGARSPHEGYFFYQGRNALHAVRSGDWKLVFPHKSLTTRGEPRGRDGIPSKHLPIDIPLALYNLRDDPGETTDVARAHPEVLAQLERLANGARDDLGDELTGRAGRGRRAAGELR